MGDDAAVEAGRSAGAGDTPHPAAVLSQLAAPDRLRCLAAVVMAARTEAEVAAATGLGPAAVHRALERLVEAGLLVRDGEGGELHVAGDVFARSARMAGRLRPAVSPEDMGADPGQARVLRGFLVDGRLRSIPVHRGKRRVVLDFLVQQFEPGRVYHERAVNAILGRFHPDYAALRRHLVDEEFLERREGFYWRAGGTFDTG